MQAILVRFQYFLGTLNPFHPVRDVPMFIVAILLSIVVFVGVMYLLHRLPSLAKKWLIIGITFVAGLFFLLEYFLPTHEVNGSQVNAINLIEEPVTDFVQIMIAWTIGLGIVSLAIVHGRRLFRRHAGWHHSLAFFLAMFAMLIAGFITHGGKSDPSPALTVYNSLFRGLLINLDSTMFALLAFYIASAAYRAFRVRTLEAGLLMAAALLVMLGFVNFGVAMTSWINPDSIWGYLRMERLSSWLLNWINMPGQRAVGIGVAIGGLAMAMRIWLSLERGAFFSQES